MDASLSRGRAGRYLNDLWYGELRLASLLLVPFGWLYCLVVLVRRAVFRSGLARVYRLGVPGVVVGNISIGGTGKTPLVGWLSEFLRKNGWNPGIVCSGYGGTARNWPRAVQPDSDPAVLGDESVLLSRRSGCPVAAGPDRVAAARSLIDRDCDVIVSDDGLQHYRLGRDLEIAVIDGERRHGNRRCLPAGPLREPPSRLDEVDVVVTNGEARSGEFEMRLVSANLVSLRDRRKECPLGHFEGEVVHAVCAIGNAARFFRLLRAHGIEVIEHEFTDHHRFAAHEVRFDDGRPVLMTEKDAIKCESFAGAEHWYLPVSAELDDRFGAEVLSLLERNTHGQEAA